MPKRPAASPTSVDETFIDVESADPAPERASAAPAVDALIGATLLDTYEILRLMGEGGMGRIYEARHVRIAHKRFAIKVLRPELVSSAQIRGRFEREVEAVARVTHPGVVAIADVGTTALGVPFMVCEHLSGLDLLAYTRRFGPLSDERVVQMGCRIAEALEAAHAHGVIHRDIKPSNIFLLGAFAPLGPEWDRVKVIDFGLSRLVGRDDLLTETGLVLGTPAYMSPEQARGLRTDHRTDVYGVGAVLYAAATGVPPFREKTPQQTLIAVMSRDPVRPRDLNPSISEELELVIQRALSKQPEERQPSMSALRLALSNLEAPARSLGGAAAARRAGGLLGVRVRYAALAASAALLLGLALVSAAVGLLPLGGDFRLTPTERVALVVSVAAALGLALRGLRRFEQRVWRNTAKLSDGLPRLRTPVFWALVVYALASFAIRFGDDVLPHLAPGLARIRSPLLQPAWGALLSLGALLTALVVALHQSWWQPMRPGRRWIWGPLLAAGLALACLAVGRWAILERSAQSLARAARDLAQRDGASGTDASPQFGARAPTNDEPAFSTLGPLAAISQAEDAGRGALDGSAGDVDAGSAGRGPLSSAEPLASAAESIPVLSVGVLPAAPAVPATAAPPSREQPSPSPASSTASSTGLTVSVTRDAELVAQPAVTNARSSEREALRLEALQHARRASGLRDAVLAIDRLLRIAPDLARDPELRRILIRAAASGGEPARAAFRVMGSSMGSHGPDLLYELMTERPSLADQAKYLLSRTRVRKLFTPELAIAYDLRFSPSCAARRGLLKRASEIGDQRAINTLAALLENPPHCGQPGRFPCLELCSSEALYFTRTIDAIVRRVRGSERAASMN